MSHVMRGELDESTRQLGVVLAPSSTPDNQSRIRSRGEIRKRQRDRGAVAHSLECEMINSRDTSAPLAAIP